jgi:pyridoxine 5-phosphate synthase
VFGNFHKIGCIFKLRIRLLVYKNATDFIYLKDYMQLLVNIDHIATLRNARGEGVPDPTKAAIICEENGAAGIVFHLREDRRHIKDHDVIALKKNVKGLVDFEMAATPEMLDICCDIGPHLVTLVPESREELTTEGGLNLAHVYDDFKNRVVPRLKSAGIEISLFVDPVFKDIELTAELGCEAIELHTGAFANATSEKVIAFELDRLKKAAVRAHELGLKVNAGHGLNFENMERFLKEVPHLADISIGHALITDALFNGLATSVKNMVNLIQTHNPQ